jgi:hypothetical protein
MLGGGFLKQMSDTVKYNASLIAKPKRKPFSKSEKKIKVERLTDLRRLTDVERYELLRQVRHDNRNILKSQLLRLLLSVVITIILFFLFTKFFAHRLIDFIK